MLTDGPLLEQTLFRKRFDTDRMNLKELSENLGLSQTTVSRALNGYPEVSEATRARVELAAKRFNYTPSTRAKGLATGRALAIGHVIPTSSKHEMVNPIFGDFIAGAGEVYARNGYEMILSVLDPRMDEETIYRKLMARRAVDGVVVHGPKMRDERIPLLQQLGLPYVVHGRASAIDTPYTWVDVNNRRAFRRATELLLDLGHERIAFINGLESMDFAQRRRQGFEDAMGSRGMSINPQWTTSGEMTEHLGYSTTANWLASDNTPTAIVTSSMISAFGVRRAIEDAGLKIGKDVSVVTHDDDLSYLRNGADVPIFTATRSSVRDAGELAASLLLDKIADPSAPDQHHLLEAQLVIGQSTGPAQTKVSS